MKSKLPLPVVKTIFAWAALFETLANDVPSLSVAVVGAVTSSDEPAVVAVTTPRATEGRFVAPLGSIVRKLAPAPTVSAPRVALS